MPALSPPSTLRAVVALSVLIVSGAGCGGRYGGTARPATPGPDAKAPPGGLAAAALPYDIVDARTGRQVDKEEFWRQATTAKAICVGEDHTNPHHHWAQLEITKRVVASLAPTDRFALGLEMVQRPFQGVLDDYAAKRIDAAALQSRTGWADRWGYDFGFYGEILDVTVAAQGQLLALNAARELTKKVVRKGLESLTPDERAQLPADIKLDDARHRAWFDDLMGSMGGAHAHSQPAAPPMPDDDVHKKAREEADATPPPEMPSADRIYAVQVIWDESMADGTATWLATAPTGHAIILAGNGHCHDTAIVGRLKRRGIAEAISVRPVLDSDGQVAEALVKPINDYLFVLRVPPSPDVPTNAPTPMPE